MVLVKPKILMMKKAFIIKAIILLAFIASNSYSKALNLTVSTVKKHITRRDTIKKDTIKRDTIKSDTLKKDTIKMDTLKKDTIKKDTLKRDTIKRDTIKKDTLKSDTAKTDSTFSQQSRARMVFLELGGPGLALTVNYDARFGEALDKWGYRVGAGYYNTGANYVFSVPLQINYLYGNNTNYVELGVGTTFLHSHGTTGGSVFQFDNITGFIGTATIGYRYQQEGGGVNFRIAFVPVLYNEGVLFEGGLSIGYSF
jgi:pentapeptide MXKDX repeat protein